MDGRVVFQLLELLARLHPPSAFLLHAHPSGAGVGKTFFLSSSSAAPPPPPPSFASDSLLVQEAIAWISLYGASPSTPPKLVTRCIRELLLLDCRELLMPIFFGCKEIIWMAIGTAQKEGSSGGSGSSGGGTEVGVRVGGSGDGALVWLTAMLHALTFHDRRSTSTPQQLWPMVEQLVSQVMLSGSVEHASSVDIRLLLEALGMVAMRAPEMITDLWLPLIGGRETETAVPPPLSEGEEENAAGCRTTETRGLSPLWRGFLEHLFMVVGQERAGELVGSLSLEESLHLVRCGIAVSPLLHPPPSPTGKSGEKEMAADVTPDRAFFSLVTRRAVELLEEVDDTNAAEQEGVPSSAVAASAAPRATTISSASVLLLQDLTLLLLPSGASMTGLEAPPGDDANETSPSSASDAWTMTLHALLRKVSPHVALYFTRGEASPDVAVSVLRLYLDREAQERWRTTTSSSSSSVSSSSSSSSHPPHTTREAKDWIERTSPTHPLSLLLGGPSLSPPPTGCGPFYEDALPASLSAPCASSSAVSGSVDDRLRYVADRLGLPACVLSLVEQHWAALLAPPLSTTFTARSRKVDTTRPATPKGGKTTGRKPKKDRGEEAEKTEGKEASEAAELDSSSSYASLVDLQAHPFPWSGESVKTLLRFWTLCHATVVPSTAPGALPSSSSTITTTTTTPTSAASLLSLAERVEHLRLYYFVVLSTLFHRTPTCITPGDFTPFFMHETEQYAFFPLVTAMVTTCMANWPVHLVLRWLRATAEEAPCTAAVRHVLRAAATSLTPFMKHASSEQLMALWYYFGRAGVRHEEFADAVAHRFGKWCEEELEALPAMASASSSSAVGGGVGRENGEAGETPKEGASSSTMGHPARGGGGPHASSSAAVSGMTAPLSSSSSSFSLRWEGGGAAAHLVGLSIVLSGFAGMEYRGRKPFLDAAPLLLRAMQTLTPSLPSCVRPFPLAEAATVLLAAYAKMLIWHFRVVWSLAEFLFALVESMTLRQLLVVQLALQRMNIQHTPLTTAFTHRLYTLAMEENEWEKVEGKKMEAAWRGGEGRGFSGLSPTDLTALLSVWSRAISSGSSTSASARPAAAACEEANHAKSNNKEELKEEAATPAHPSSSSSSPASEHSAENENDTVEEEETKRVIMTSFQRAIAARLMAYSAVEQAELLVSLARLNAVDEVTDGKPEEEGKREENNDVAACTSEKHVEDGEDIVSTTPYPTPSLSSSSSSSSATATARTTTTTASLFDQITAQILFHLPTTSPVALAHVLHAYALVGRKHDELFSLVAQRVTRCKTDIAAVTIASILASFAATGTADTAFFMEMIPRVRFVAQFGTPRDVTNVVFAYASVKVWHFKLFARLADRAIQLRMEFSPVHLVRLMQAYGMVEMRYDTLFTEMSPRIQAVADLLSPNGLATIVESYARVHMHCPPVFEVCANEATKSASKFTLEEAERLLGALETVGHVHPKVWLALWTEYPDALRGKFLGVQQKMYVNPAANEKNAQYQSNPVPTPPSPLLQRKPLHAHPPFDAASPHHPAADVGRDRPVTDATLLETEEREPVMPSHTTFHELHAMEVEQDELAPPTEEGPAVEEILATERAEGDK